MDAEKTIYGNLIIHGSDGFISISKELYEGDSCIVFEHMDTDNEVYGDWSVELLFSYKRLVELRRAMNYYFFVDGIMKDDVKEVSEVMKDDGFNFTELFMLCVTLDDKSLSYYSTYYINIDVVNIEEKHFSFPFVHMRHSSGVFYSELLSTMFDIADAEDPFNEEIPLINAKPFDIEFYLEFSKMRTRLNGKLFETNNKLLNTVTTFLDKYSFEIIGQAIKFGDYLCDGIRDKNPDYISMDIHPMSNALGCYIANLISSTEEFKSLNNILENVGKKAITMLRVDTEGSSEGDEATKGEAFESEHAEASA
jgi:hypothetical protein